MRHALPAILWTLALAVVATESVRAQADPVWLEQWNVAVASRPATLSTSARIAPATEPGTPLRIHGTVLTPEGRPAPGVEVFSYHRDEAGFDFGPGDAHTETWRLQGWVVTDQDGRFGFSTFRPATAILDFFLAFVDSGDGPRIGTGLA